MPFITSEGVKIYYEDHGKGPTVLLSHGFSSSSRMWGGQIGLLAKSYRVIIWDMRGHGQSDYPENPDRYSEAATIGDMTAILDACGVDEAVLGGLSLGGYMSLAFHILYPDRVRALMLFDTGPGYKSDQAREGWNKGALQRAEEFESKGLAAFDDDDAKMTYHRSADGLALAARGMLAQKDSRIIWSLPDIKTPTLVLVGADDAPFLGAADYMTKKIPNAVKVTIPDAGHASNRDQPEKFNKSVVAFLSDI